VNLNTKTVELKTPGDYRSLGTDLDKLIAAVKEQEYGVYRIKKEQRHLFVIVSNMVELQISMNKGLRMLGGFDTQKIEIYDYTKQQERLDKAIDDFSL
jgi:hypothetical protein